MIISGVLPILIFYSYLFQGRNTQPECGHTPQGSGGTVQVGGSTVIQVTPTFVNGTELHAPPTKLGESESEHCGPDVFLQSSKLPDTACATALMW